MAHLFDGNKGKVERVGELLWSQNGNIDDPGEIVINFTQRSIALSDYQYIDIVTVARSSIDSNYYIYGDGYFRLPIKNYQEVGDGEDRAFYGYLTKSNVDPLNYDPDYNWEKVDYSRSIDIENNTITIGTAFFVVQLQKTNDDIEYNYGIQGGKYPHLLPIKIYGIR